MNIFKNKIIGCKLAIALIFTALVMVSCSEKQDSLVVSKDFANEQWGRFENVVASYNAVKAPMIVDVVMDLTVSDEFPNIYPYYKNDGDFRFCMSLVGCDGSHRAREYKYILKDKDGNWKSEKTDGYYHFQFCLINELNISEIGEYKFNIENKYSKDPLFGIKNLTIRCVPSKTK